MIKPQQSQLGVRVRRNQPRGPGVRGQGSATVDFYTNVLGMPLIKSLDLPGDMGQHFFFDAGNGDCIAFFGSVRPPTVCPDLGARRPFPASAKFVSATGSLNHIALHVPAEKFDEYRQEAQGQGRSRRAGAQPRRQPDAGVGHGAPRRLRPVVLLLDPDGITLEFACWTKEFTDDDARRRPRRRPPTSARARPGASPARPARAIVTLAWLSPSSAAPA